MDVNTTLNLKEFLIRLSLDEHQEQLRRFYMENTRGR